MSISVSRSALPLGREDLDRALQDYFAFDYLATWAERGESVEVSLVPPPTSDFYIDPQLEIGLAWWGDGIKVEDIPHQHRDLNGTDLFLNDAWTLLSWSRWLASFDEDPGKVTILHIDDHEDLMSPRLARNDGRTIDMITGKELLLSVPATVEAAILSGAIGMGSFIAPFIHEYPTTDLRHLKGRGPDQEQVPMVPVMEPDTLLAPGRDRLTTVRSADLPKVAGTYMRTTSPEVWADHVDTGPVLLHIDLDYFNNRYDGDSDWRDHPPRHDPGPTEISTSVDRIFDVLHNTGIMPRIQNITIGVSPGFFPAEFWSSTTQRILDRVAG